MASYYFVLALMATLTLAAAGQDDEKTFGESEKRKSVLLGTCAWDIDSNEQKVTKGADVWWEQVADEEAYLVPRGKAGIAVLGDKPLDEVTYKELTEQKYSSKKIAKKTLTPGTVVAMRTDEGQFAKLKVVGYRDLHDFTFPEAKLLDEKWKEFVLKIPNKDYHLEVEWIIYKE